MSKQTNILSLETCISPQMIYERLEKNIEGQEEAKRMICSTLFLHFSRYCQFCYTGEEVPKSNALLMGPTGCGKTYIVREAAKAARDILGHPIFPLLEVDCTELTARGWEGDDITKLLSNHAKDCKRNNDIFPTSIVFLDEFDKICRPAVGKGGSDHNRNTQYNLLKIIEGTTFRAGGIKVDTSNILFILAGNFAEIRSEREKQNKVMGFHSPSKDKTYIDYHTELEKAGMATQLVGRVPHIAEVYDLDESQLMNILEKYVLPEYRSTWRYLGRQLQVPVAIKQEIVKNCYKRKTGARGLHADVAKYIEAKLFDMELWL